MPCLSTIPGRDSKPTGWTCTGDGLVSVMTVPHDGGYVPVACPADRVPTTSHADAYDVRPYDGKGNHLHLVLHPASRDQRRTPEG